MNYVQRVLVFIWLLNILTKHEVTARHFRSFLCNTSAAARLTDRMSSFVTLLNHKAVFPHVDHFASVTTSACGKYRRYTSGGLA